MAVKVFIDANLLFYKMISDLLFDASNLGLINAHWSQEVIDEYLEHGPRVLNEIRVQKGLAESIEIAQKMVHRKVELFRDYSGFILVEDYDLVDLDDEHLEDKDDIHILKAALKSECSVLLTLDKDFRKITSIGDLDIVARKADNFFCELLEKYEKQMLDVIEKTRKGIERQRDEEVSLNRIVEMMEVGHLKELALKLQVVLAK